MLKKRFLFPGIFLLLFFGIFQLFFRAEADHARHRNQVLPTNYEYECPELDHLHSTYLISDAAIEKWDLALQDYFRTIKVSTPIKWRFYTYLYLAERDAAFLSYNIHSCFIGSLDPLIHRLILQFFPEFPNQVEMTSDPYSEALAGTVLSKYEARIQKEENNPHTFESSPCWSNEISASIAYVAKWIPWISPLPKPPPPKFDVKAEMEEMKRLRRHLTDEEIQLAKEYAHFDFIEFINEYMKENNVPLGKVLLVRSLMMQAIYDTFIATLDAKYRYCIPRPEAIDSSTKPLFSGVPTSSYPSGHAATAMAVATVLSHFFPDDCPFWRTTAEKIGESRIWAGVHTPQDVEAGYELGEEVGLAELNLK